MKRLNKIITVVLAGVLIMSMAGCGQVSESNAAETESTKETESANEADSTKAEEVNDIDEENDDQKELTKVQIGVDAALFAYVPVVAKEKGFFESHGIDAELVNFSFGIDTINAVVLNQVQIGFAYDYAGATRLAEKSNLRVAANLLVNKPDSSWYETTIVGAKSIADTKGAKIGYGQGTVAEYNLARELEFYGLSEDDFELVPFSSNAEIVTAYAAGEIDVSSFGNSYQKQLDAIPNRTKLNTLGDIEENSQAYVFADDAFLKDNEELFSEFLQAIQEGIDYINNNLDESSKIIADVMTLDAEDVANNWSDYDWALQFTQEDFDHLQNIVDWASEHDMIDYVDINDYTDASSITEVFPDKVTYEVK